MKDINRNNKQFAKIYLYIFNKLYALILPTVTKYDIIYNV